MKSLKPLILLFTILTAISSCRKPDADFTTDKTEYTAGDTIHIIDLSEHAKKWNWTLPDGSISHEKNVDFVIDINEIDCTKNILLEATSKNGKRSSSVTKSVKIKQGILPSDFYTYGSSGIKTIPTTKSASTDGKNWLIVAKVIDSKHPESTNMISIFLPGTTRPTQGGTYNLQPYSNTTLTSNQACVSIEWFGPDYKNSVVSLSGQLNLSIVSNDKVRAIFDNVNGRKRSVFGAQVDTTYVNMAGDITCY